MQNHRLKTNWLCIWFGGVLLTISASVRASDPPANAEKPGNARSRVPFTISKETTWITEPLKTDGSPDYEAALNARSSKDVTPENNATVLLMKLFGAKIIEERHREKIYKLLGVPLPVSVDGVERGT